MLMKSIDVSHLWEHFVRRLLLAFRTPKPSARNSFNELLLESNIGQSTERDVANTIRKYRKPDDEDKGEY